MQITPHGAAGDVTGSAYLVETDRARVLVDFGMFQGSKRLEEKNVVPPELDPPNLDAVVVTHAHLDHTGRLPMLVRAGYQREFHATDATIDMADLILRDSAKIQEADTARENRARSKHGQEPLQPLYTIEDADDVLRRMRAAPYHEPVVIASGISVRFVDSGHMLGSTSIEMTIEEGNARKVIIFSGDLGPAGMVWLRDAETFQQADFVILESTYGNRNHRPLELTLEEGREIIIDAADRNGKILVPSFAIGRTQQLLYYVAALFRDNEVEKFPVFVDSPMAIKATKVYAEHPELYDDEAIALAQAGRFAKDLSSVTATPTVADSKRINEVEGVSMVISASGMCNGGRILHHLRHNLWRPETSVILVGYQAHGSLGRELVEGADEVTIFGDRIPVRAQIHTLGGFSAHAGQKDLLRWFEVVAGSQPRVALTHGEQRPREELASVIHGYHRIEAELPVQGETLRL